MDVQSHPRHSSRRQLVTISPQAKRSTWATLTPNERAQVIRFFQLLLEWDTGTDARPQADIEFELEVGRHGG